MKLSSKRGSKNKRLSCFPSRRGKMSKTDRDRRFRPIRRLPYQKRLGTVQLGECGACGECGSDGTAPETSRLRLDTYLVNSIATASPSTPGRLTGAPL